MRYELFALATFPDPDNQTVSRWLIAGLNVPSLADERMVFPASSSDHGGRDDRNNFAPRLGIACSVSDKTVIRTGGVVFYGEPNSLSIEGANFRAGAPRHTEIALQTNLMSTNFFVRGGFLVFDNSTIRPNVAAYVLPDRRDNLAACHWFFNFQRSLPFDTLLTLGYAGTRGVNLFAGCNINLPFTPSATVPANRRLIRPQFSSVTAYNTMLQSTYNAFTAKADKRFSKGLTFLTSFTYSKNIDQGERRPV